jgi:hypothetical protein
MKLSMVLICWRCVEVPVPGAAGVLEKASSPKSLANPSSGSLALNAIGVYSPGVSSLRPKS